MKNIIMIFLILVVAFGCDKDDDCIEYEKAYVTEVNSPEEGVVNEVINIEVQFQIYNSCGNFSKFIKVVNGNTTTIEVQAKYDVCTGCLDVITPITVNYEFNTPTPGDYILKFKSTETEFITVNITIE